MRHHRPVPFHPRRPVSTGWRALLPLLLALLAVTVPAQKEPQPGSVKDRGKRTGPRLVVPGGPEAGPQEPAAPSAAAVDRVTRGELGKLLEPLSYLPGTSSRAKGLVERFLVTPERDLLPMLSTVFRRGRSARVRGAVRVLAALKSAEGVKLLRRSLLEQPFNKVTREALLTAWQLDREGTRPFLFECLASGHGELRKEGEGLLRRHMRPADKEPLAALARAKRPDTRLRALRLLTVLMPPGAEEIFVAALDDSHRACRRRAGKGLGLAGSFPASARALVVGGPAGGEVFRGALLAAIRQEVRRPGKVLDKAWVPALVEALASSDKVVVALAGAALAHLAYASDDLTGKPYRERQVMEALVGIVEDRKYYPGQGDAQAVATRALRTLSGRGQRYTGADWRRWWNAEREVFSGNRARLPLDKPANRRRTVVVLADRVETHVVRPQGAPWAHIKDSKEVVIGPEEQDRLVARLLSLGIMDHPLDPDREIRGGVGIHLWLADRRLRVLAPPRTPWIEAMVKEILDTVGRHQWQLYGPRGVARKRWLAEQTAFFAKADPATRRRRTKELVVARLPQLDGPHLMRALGHLLDIDGVETLLTDADVDVLLSCIKEEKYVGPKVEGVLYVVSQVPGLKAWTKVLDYLDRTWRQGGKLVLPKFLLRADRKRLEAAFRHRGVRTRSGVIRHLADRRVKGWDARLQGCLTDAEADIRSAALWALARREDFSALPKVLVLARTDPVPKVRRGAINFLGRSRMQRVLPVLVASLNDTNPSIRMAAVQALGASRLPAAAGYLSDMLAVDPTGPGGRLVRRTLLNWGGPIVRRALQPLLVSPRQELREAAVWLLADLLDPAVIPTLIKWLGDPERIREVPQLRKALCAITCAPCAKDWVRFYDRWYLSNQEKSDAAWFVQALQEARYRVTFKEADLLPGAGLGAVRELVQLLREADEWFLRVQAAHRLREITGESFGVVEMETGKAAIEAIASAWLGWLAKQEKAGR